MSLQSFSYSSSVKVIYWTVSSTTKEFSSTALGGNSGGFCRKALLKTLWLPLSFFRAPQMSTKLERYSTNNMLRILTENCSLWKHYLNLMTKTVSLKKAYQNNDYQWIGCGGGVGQSETPKIIKQYGCQLSSD